jgi:hypothetical protein
VRACRLPIKQQNGNGGFSLPIKRELRAVLGKEAGDRVTVKLEERLD